MKDTDKLKRLEAKFDALTHYLKVDIVAEVDEEGWWTTLVKRYSKDGWRSLLR